jgi:hypothetical protein
MNIFLRQQCAKVKAALTISTANIMPLEPEINPSAFLGNSGKKLLFNTNALIKNGKNSE